MLQRDANKRVIDTRVAGHLTALGARGPSEAEESSLRALARGSASAGQQKMALRYVLELAGAGDLVFAPDNERLTAFRLGSQAAAQALATIAGGVLFAFRAQEDGDGHRRSDSGAENGDGDNGQ